jgi:hypothetical protein
MSDDQWEERVKKGYMKALLYQKVRNETDSDMSAPPSVSEQMEEGEDSPQPDRDTRKKKVRTGTDKYGRPKYEVRRIPIDGDEDEF